MEGFLNNRDLIQVFMQWISPLSFKMLSEASSTFWRKRKCTFPHFFRERLFRNLCVFYGGFEEVAHLIMDACDREEAAITGGFLLATLQGDNIMQVYDVDLLVFTEHVFDQYGPLDVGQRYPHALMNILFVNNYCKPMAQNQHHKMIDAHYETPLLNSVIEFNIHDKPLQFICMDKQKSTFKSYIAKFDLNFCKNMYTAGRLYVKDWQSVLFRTCTLNIDQHYMVKGYVRDANSIRHIYGPKIYQRLCKYVKLGYNVCIERITSQNYEHFAQKLHTVNVVYIGPPEFEKAAIAWLGFWDHLIKEEDGRIRIL